MLYFTHNGPLLMRGGAPHLQGYFPGGGVAPMDIEDVCMLMISFGMLIAFVMSSKNEK